MGAHGGVLGTRGGGGPVRVLVVLRRGAVQEVGGARAYADTWTRGYGRCLGVGSGPMAAAVVGHLLDLLGLVWGWGRHWLPLVLLRPRRGGWAVDLGSDFCMVPG